MPHADFEVIRQILAGKTGAFDALVSRHQQTIFRLTYRMTRNTEDARDLAQETFVQAYRSLGSFRQQSSFSTWLYRIAMNLCLNHLKAAGREDPAEVDARVPDGREDSLTALLTDERDRAVAAAIAELPHNSGRLSSCECIRGSATVRSPRCSSVRKGRPRPTTFTRCAPFRESCKRFRAPGRAGSDLAGFRGFFLLERSRSPAEKW